jgi:hypothetical protein
MAVFAGPFLDDEMGQRDWIAVALLRQQNDALRHHHSGGGAAVYQIQSLKGRLERRYQTE